MTNAVAALRRSMLIERAAIADGSHPMLKHLNAQHNEHVFDWLSWKMRCRLVIRNDQAIVVSVGP